MKNPLRRRLRANETAYGLWVTVESPTVTEIAVALGLDWVCIDMEHGPMGYQEVMGHLRAVRGTETAAVVRVPELQWSAIKRALDLGAHGVIVPYVQSREDVETAFRYGKYPPRGLRGVSGERCVKWGLGSQDYLACANEETLIIPLIEARAAVEDIDAILDVPGIEALFFGPADMSASYGHLGEWEGPGVAEQILSVRAKAEAKGIAAGVMSRSVADAIERRDQGFQMVGLGTDMPLLIRTLTESLEKVGRKTTPRLWF